MVHAHSAPDRLEGQRGESNRRQYRGDQPNDERDLIGCAQRLSDEGSEDAKHQDIDRRDKIRCARQDATQAHARAHAIGGEDTARVVMALRDE